MNSTFFFEKGVVMKKQFDERNLTMVMDFYELTMANGYFKDEDKERKVAFDVFYRKNPDNAGYAIFAGLEQIIEYIENLHFDEDDIEYNPDDECDEVYSDLIDDALESGFSMKISKLYLTGFKDDALEEAKKFVKAKLPNLDQETSDRYAASIVQDYKDLAWEQE
jgi:hypothetical protein